MCDSGNHRVQVLRPDAYGTFARQWGSTSQGAAPGQVEYPSGQRPCHPPTRCLWPTAIIIECRCLTSMAGLCAAGAAKARLQGNFVILVAWPCTAAWFWSAIKAINASSVSVWMARWCKAAGADVGQPRCGAGAVRCARGPGGVVGQRGVCLRHGQPHRVQVFDLDGTFRRSWGSQGTSPGQFQYPRGVPVTVSSAGGVLVSDATRACRCSCPTGRVLCGACTCPQVLEERLHQRAWP